MEFSDEEIESIVNDLEAAMAKLKPKPTATLSVVPSAVRVGDTVVVTWTTTRATSVTLDGAPVPLSGSKSFTVAEVGTKVFVLAAANQAELVTVTASVVVSATIPIPTATISVTPEEIEEGQTSKLAWTATDATSVTINGEAVALSGERILVDFAAGSHVFTLTAVGSGGTCTAVATLTVTAKPVPNDVTAAVKASARAVENSHDNSHSYTVSWETTGTESVFLNGEPVAPSGSRAYTGVPLGDHDYAVMAESVTAVARVTVIPHLHSHDDPDMPEHAASMALVPTKDATEVAYNGVLPALPDGTKLIVPQGVVATIDSVHLERFTWIRVDGKLRFAPDKNTSLLVETIVISEPGVLEMGTPEEPVRPDVKAELIIADGMAASGDTCSGGPEKTPFVSLDKELEAGDRQLSMETAPVGWKEDDSDELPTVGARLRRHLHSHRAN